MMQAIGFVLLALVTGALLGAAVAQSLTSLAIFAVASGAWLAYSTKGTSWAARLIGIAAFMAGLFSWLNRTI